MKRNGKAVGRWALVLGLMFGLMSGLSVFAIADESVDSKPAAPGCIGESGNGGGQMPDPLGSYNQFAELADQEMYLLVGWIRILPGAPGASSYAYLEVDLQAHPWLAGSKRRRYPFYHLEDETVDWSRLDGVQARLATRAHVRVVHDREGHELSVITLQPFLELSKFSSTKPVPGPAPKNASSTQR